MPRHNGTMTCILGRSGPWEFRAITPRRGAEACGSHQETQKQVGSSGSQWKTSGGSGRRAEAGGRPGRGQKRKGSEDQEGVGRGQEGPEYWKIYTCTNSSSSISLLYPFMDSYSIFIYHLLYPLYLRIFSFRDPSCFSTRLLSHSYCI